MSAHKQLNIGLFGFGVVGAGLYRVLQQTPSLNATIRKICIKHPEKEREAPASLFTTDRDELLNDTSINVIVEVIDDAAAAFEIVQRAFATGKSVVSASKKMIAEQLAEILQMQRDTGLSFLYESAACASIPVIRNLEEYYDNDLLHAIKAIVNGSTNFILTRIFEDRLEFADALRLAQELGFAESDPRLDIEGYDAVNKWTLLLTHAYGIVRRPEDILFNGIQNILLSDARIAREKGYTIKLVAQAKKLSDGSIAAFVLPQLVSRKDQLAFVRNEYNGVVIESGFADKQFFYGKGAGSFPTASAVLSDLAALRYDYKYEYKKLYYHESSRLADDFYLRVYISLSEWSALPKNELEWVDEWHSGQHRSYLTGVIHYRKLKDSDWWKNNGISLILAPEAIIEKEELASLKPSKAALSASEAVV